MPLDSPARTSRKPRGQGPSRRAEILAAAKRLFVTEGYAHATIRRIAAETGVSSAALYIYFPDKDAILRAIAEDTFERLLTILAKSQRPEDTTEARFRAGLAAYIGFGQAHPDEYRLTFLTATVAPSAPGRPCRSPDGIEAADRSFAILAECIGQGMAEGLFQPGDPVQAAEAVWAATHGATLLLLDHQDHLESTAEALTEAVIAMALQGIRATRSNDH